MAPWIAKLQVLVSDLTIDFEIFGGHKHKAQHLSFEDWYDT